MPQGSFTALVGPSGGGKSTVARLIARFWDVTGGSISIGGTNIKELSIRQLSELVSFVTQDNFLFNCSLKENIRLGNPNATDEEVYAAAKAACCDDFIVRLEKGYDTEMGQGGVNVSGGQKQRICIARAILKKPKVLILDDSTSAVDTATEARIRSMLAEKLPGMTKIIIAQRISSVRHADKIVVLEDGRVQGIGTHEELLAGSRIYREIYESQKEGADL